MTLWNYVPSGAGIIAVFWRWVLVLFRPCQIWAGAQSTGTPRSAWIGHPVSPMLDWCDNAELRKWRANNSNAIYSSGWGISILLANLYIDYLCDLFVKIEYRGCRLRGIQMILSAHCSRMNKNISGKIWNEPCAQPLVMLQKPQNRQNQHLSLSQRRKTSAFRSIAGTDRKSNCRSWLPPQPDGPKPETWPYPADWPDYRRYY